MVKLPLVRDFAFDYGQVEQVSSLIRRVIANNPSPFTFAGTGTYIVGRNNVAIIDPGPADQLHIDAILQVLEGERITHVFVTHTHADHSPGCALLNQQRRITTYGFGAHQRFQDKDELVVEEPADFNFVPDVQVKHEDLIVGENWTIRCLHTPGHTSNHMCYLLEEEKALFTGDHVMGWSTSVISPPDGDMSNYMDSLQMLLDLDVDVYWPTHGPPIHQPNAHVKAFIDHRLEREQQVLRCVSEGIHTIDQMVPIIYESTKRILYPAAARSLYATIIHLIRNRKLTFSNELCEGSKFFLA